MGKYKKKERAFLDSSLARVVADVKSERISLRQGAKELNVSVTFLRDRVAGKMSLQNSKETRGRKTVLTSLEEEQLSDYLKILAKWGFGTSRQETIDTVAEYCKDVNRSTPFKNGIPGKDWYVGFAQRHLLKLKNTEQREKCRLQNTANPYMVYEFYDILKSVANELGIADKPDHFFNLDEMGASKDPSRTKIVAGKTQKNLFRTIQGSGKDNTTIMGCICANGSALPPMFIFKAVNLWSTWKGARDIPGTFYAVADRGFVNADIFYEYLGKFASTVKVRRIILVYDGHITHMSLKVVNLARKENISIIKLPSHTTDLMQPLDKACFDPLKQKLDQVMIKWQRENQRSQTKSEFVDQVCEVWYEGLSPINIISGFRGCGIFPINRDKFPITRLNPELLKQYLQSKEDQDKQEGRISVVSGPLIESTGPVIESFPQSSPSTSHDLLESDNVTLDVSEILIDGGDILQRLTVPHHTDIPTSQYLDLDPDFVITSGPEEHQFSAPQDLTAESSFNHESNLNCDEMVEEPQHRVARDTPLVPSVTRPTRTLKRPKRIIEINTSGNPSRGNDENKKPKLSGVNKCSPLLLKGQISFVPDAVIQLPQTQPLHASTQAQNFPGTEAKTNDSNTRAVSFETLLLKKVGSTKPKNETRRLIHAKAAVITSD